MNNKNYWDTRYPLDKTYKKAYNERDLFLEGFNSANTSSLRKEKQTLQKPTLQTLPYRSSVDSGAKFQTLPYIPKDEIPKTTLYSKSPTTYAHMTKTPQTPWEKAWNKIKEPFEDQKNLSNELARISGNMSPETKAAMKTILNPWSDRNSREKATSILKNEIKKTHYKRNEYNVDLPETKEIAEKWGWESELAACHQNTASDKEKAPHIKYVSPDGKREVIFDHTGMRVITADEDVGTYNYADPDLGLAHTLLDILPWLAYGNTPEDPTEWYERIGGLLPWQLKKYLKLS